MEAFPHPWPVLQLQVLVECMGNGLQDIARPMCSPKRASPSTASGDAGHLSDCVQHGLSVAEKCSSIPSSLEALPCLIRT